jgi:predicted metal-binding protein
MTDRKFYKTVIQVEVLSEEPFDYEDLADVYSAITEGDCSGKLSTWSQEVLDGKQAADALINQASDPSFFMLTQEGDDEE